MEITFTPGQAIHAQEVAMRLYKERRFFLPVDIGLNTSKTLPYLSKTIFGDLYALDEQLHNHYRFTAKRIEEELSDLEIANGLKPPTLKSGRNVVECKRYSGGLEIVAVVPLSALMVDLDTDCEILGELLEKRFPTPDRDESMTSDVNTYRKILYVYTTVILNEFKMLSQESEYENKSVVILNTRFNPGSRQDDIMLGKVNGLVTYPNLASYVLYKAQCAGMGILKRCFTITSPSRKNHAEIILSKDTTLLNPTANSGYYCTISFATIL